MLNLFDVIMIKSNYSNTYGEYSHDYNFIFDKCSKSYDIDSQNLCESFEEIDMMVDILDNDDKLVQKTTELGLLMV